MADNRKINVFWNQADESDPEESQPPNSKRAQVPPIRTRAQVPPFRTRAQVPPIRTRAQVPPIRTRAQTPPKVKGVQNPPQVKGAQISHLNGRINEKLVSRASQNTDSRHQRKLEMNNEAVRANEESNQKPLFLQERPVPAVRRERNYAKEKAPRQFPIGFQRLKELIEKDATDILFTLSLKDSGFSLLLQEQNTINRNTLAYALIALSRACKSKAYNIVSKLINNVTSNRNFWLFHVLHFVALFDRNLNEQYHYAALNGIVDFLKSFQLSQASSAADLIPMLLPSLKNTTTKAFPDIDEQMRFMAKINELEEENDHFMKNYTPDEIKKLSKKERQQLQEPPESYRSIPVLPNEVDIHQSCGFLRPNVVQGRYQDTEHYLDVQFRLLREDYVRPLREGIAEYLRVKKSKGSFKRNKDVRVYQDVRIVKQEFVNGVLLHFANFNADEFKRVRWESSKRFLSGSLLCLTTDDFQTMLFASVARRAPEDLKKGLLLLRFEEITDAVLTLNPLMSFVVVETDAYFEAYRYNLQALHDLREDTLPMKQYIVEVQKTINHPHYISRATTYDMRPLFLPLNQQQTLQETDNSKIQTQYNFPQNIQKMKSVPVLSDANWPTANEIGLDDSQYAAVKAAVTEEFSVIQGPPGTGKTYVGLRIVQLLLHNYEKWQPAEEHSPILIVCYTNHALDQFLEGVLQFTRHIVRVGGRGTNETLANYQLNNLKQQIKEKRDIPHSIFRIIKQKHWDLRELKKLIDGMQKDVNKCNKSVLGERELRDCMDVNQYDSLKKVYQEYARVCGLVDDGNVMHDWLGVRVGTVEQPITSDILSAADEQEFLEGSTANQINNVNEQNPANKNDTDANEEVDSEGEADVEYIEAQRDIDNNEFADVSYVQEENPEEPDIIVPENQDGWQVQGGKKAMRNYVERCLRIDDIMPKREAERITNVWELSIEDRWRLYRYWLNCYIEEKRVETYIMQTRLKNEYKELMEMRVEEDLHVLKKAYVVGMTTTGASKYRNIVQRLNPRILIVEEAAEILESHIVTSLAPDTQHVILIGDHQQLRPSPTVHFLAVQYDLNVSLFERMVKNGMECHRLSVQHRMRPEIAALLVPHIYKELQNHDSVMNCENIKGIGKNVFFLSHSEAELQEYDSKSRVNQHEANFLIRLCKHIILQGYEPSQITVLTTYSGQMFALKNLATGVVKNVRITVVDNYQGEENDIILISFVRSNEEGVIGFLKVSNRVCVALSRAKKALYCIGNFDLLTEKSDLWKNIVGTLNQQKAIGTSLQLVCQNHPEVSVIVSKGTDFEAAPEGGCKRQCEYRLECGHTCSLVCHPYDPTHESVRCQKPCSKTLCFYEHICPKKCFQECGKCIKMMPKTMLGCHHTVKVKCHELDSEMKCTAECERILSCGHRCCNKCCEPCTTQCKQLVFVQSPICGHKVSVQCFQTDDLNCYISNCNTPCNIELQCGHVCGGTCSRCHQGRVHILCRKKCQRILVCGHECKAPCSKSCPPCKKKCQNRCKHNKCPHECGQPCVSCREQCDWSCEHSKCEKLCGELCKREPCNEPCKKLLKCKHPCIGLCGDPCPKLCRICNEEEVTEMFFGSEDEPDARFVLLEDCNHIFEVDKLKFWMEMDSGKAGEIQMKMCPKCKTVVRRNQRFGNIVKLCLEGIEQVKLKTFGDIERNNLLRQSLMDRLLNVKVFGFEKLCEPIMKALMSGKKRSIQEITTLENVSNLALELFKFTKNLEALPIGYFSLNKIGNEVLIKTMEGLLGFLKATYKMIQSFIQDEFLTASEQQMQEVLQEIHRLELGDAFLLLTADRLISEPNAAVVKLIAKALTKYSPFGKQDVSNVKTWLQKLAQSLGSAVLNISDSEKSSILKAMALARGHWYQCPNGHVYCITECGGAMQESHCPDCGAKIGGSSHRLLSDNRVATDMDGSRHSAWTDADNLMNYNF